MDIYKASLLDMLEGLDTSTTPAMYAYFTFDKQPNIEKLYHAVCKCFEIVPELSSRYNYKKNRFETIQYTKEDLIHEVNSFHSFSWDITKETQIKIYLLRNENSPQMCIALSHVVSDGAGFKQLLYMLCAFYNEENINLMNQRVIDFSSIIKIDQTQKRCSPHYPKLQSYPGETSCFMLQEQVYLPTLTNIAHKFNVSVNDILLYGYIKALHERTGENFISIPCPVDLRKFLNTQPTCSITNFTGEYHVNIDNIHQLEPIALLQTIHEQMLEERKQNYVLQTIVSTNKYYSFIPKRVCSFFAKKVFHLPITSFTNIGILEEDKLLFEHMNLSSLYITTRFRTYPSF